VKHQRVTAESPTAKPRYVQCCLARVQLGLKLGKAGHPGVG
jgi:hypothetical protein